MEGGTGLEPGRAARWAGPGWIFLAFSAFGNPNFNLPLDRPYTLRNATPFLLEAEYHRMLVSSKQRSYVFPRACFSEVDSSQVCRPGGLWSYVDEGRQERVDLGVQGGLEYRYTQEHVQAYDPGISVMGGSGPVSFYLDARMFTEIHEDALHPSYDREYVDRQDKDLSGSVAYTSFARYRSNLSYDWSWGRLSVARDAVHWGPGLFHNLMFHQDAVPFPQLVFTTYLGPFSVTSLYGQLAIQGDVMGNYPEDSLSRTLYAHRYEWQIGSDWLFGVSEHLIFQVKNAPFAFTPFVPLFITKGFEHERYNNGNLSGDLSYRLPGVGSVYSEFLIDDIYSPTALFNDFWGNKWAWMAGIHGTRSWNRWEGGLIGEYSRVEPWVYTSYQKGTRQTANAGYPLGNQLGPNSQAITFKSYLRLGEAYLSWRLDLQWKGTDLGSSIDDDRSGNPPLKKEFLRGIDRPEILFAPFFSYSWKSLAAEIRGISGSRSEFSFRLGLRL